MHDIRVRSSFKIAPRAPGSAYSADETRAEAARSQHRIHGWAKTSDPLRLRLWSSMRLQIRSSAGLPASRNQAAREDPGIPEAHGS